MPATLDMYESGVVRFGSFPSPAHADFPDAPPVPVQIDFSRLNNPLAIDMGRRIAGHLSFSDTRFTGVARIGNEIDDVVAAFLATRRRLRSLITITHEGGPRYELDAPTYPNGRCIVLAATTDDLRRYRQFAVPLRIFGWRIVGAIAMLGWGCERLYSDKPALPPVHILETYEEIAGRNAELGRVNMDVYKSVRDYPALVAEYLAEHEEASVHFPAFEAIAIAKRA